MTVVCVIPRIPKGTKLDEMIRNRYLAGNVLFWDLTALRQVPIGLTHTC